MQKRVKRTYIVSLVTVFICFPQASSVPPICQKPMNLPSGTNSGCVKALGYFHV